MRKRFLVTTFALALIACDKKEPPSILIIDSLDPVELITVVPGSGVGPDTTPGIAPSSAAALPVDTLNATAVETPDAFATPTDAAVSSSLENINFSDLSRDDREVEMHVTANYVDSCVGLNEIRTVPCSLAGFFVSLSDVFLGALASPPTLTHSPTLQIQGTTSGGATVRSNAFVAQLFNVVRVNDNSTGNTDEVSNLVTFGGSLYFRAKTGSTHKTFKTDGISVQTVSLTDMRPIIVFNKKLLLYGVENKLGSTFQKIYEFDGTTLSQISNINSTTTNGVVTTNGDDGFTSPVIFNKELYFTALDGTNTHNIYRYDGTRFQKVTAFTASGDSIIPRAVTTKWLYFTDTNGPTSVLYRTNPDSTDPAAKNLVAVTDTHFAIPANATFFVLNDTLYFSGTFSAPASTPGVFKVTDTAITRVATTPFLDVAVTANNIAYAVVDPAGNGQTYNLLRYDGIELLQLNDNQTSLERNTIASRLLLDGDDVYFLVTVPGNNGASYEQYRYRRNRLERLFQHQKISAGSGTDQSAIYNGEFYFVNTNVSEKSLYRMKEI